jgi:plastocyanin
MRTMGFLAAMLAGLSLLPAAAAELPVRVVDGRGQPVADAVVTAWPRDHRAAPPPAPARRVIDQKDLAFVPYLEIFRPDDEVVFRNSDSTRHHVYSFSPVRKFDFVLAPRQSSPPLRLERTGVVAVGCNIHDQMVAYLYVSDAPWIVRTDARGRAVLDGLPPGRYEVRAWQPRLKPGRAEPVQAVVLGGDSPAKPLVFALPLLPDPRLRFDREHMHY